MLLFYTVLYLTVVLYFTVLLLSIVFCHNPYSRKAMASRHLFLPT